jgi:hypothetical protein
MRNMGFFLRFLFLGNVLRSCLSFKSFFIVIFVGGFDLVLIGLLGCHLIG